MPRITDIKQKGFIWLPRESPAIYDIKINSESIKTKIWSAEFTRAVCPEIGFFKIILDNNNAEYTDKFTHDTGVELFIDFVDGTTRRFYGLIDTLKNVYDDKGFTIEVAGNHISGELLNITVTESFNAGHTISEILTQLNTTYLSGYTINYTCTDTATKPTINWNNKPFWECIFDLTKLVNADTYVDDNKIIQFFDKNSILNENETIVWNDTLISTEGLGTETLTKKDKIIVYGDDGEGLPIISVSGTGTKESVIFDSKITTENMADELSNAEYSVASQTNLEGKAISFILPSLQPGQKIWITNPTMNILDSYPIYKYTHKFYDEQTECFIQTDKDTPHLFKKRIENELALQTITNPYKCTTSLNLTFDSYDELTAHDSNISLSEGKVKLSSGVEGTFTATKTLTSNISFIHLKAVGSNLIGTTYQFSTDGGDTIMYIIPEAKITVPAGTSIWIKVNINSASTEMDSLAVLMG